MKRNYLYPILHRRPSNCTKLQLLLRRENSCQVFFSHLRQRGRGREERKTFMSKALTHQRTKPMLSYTRQTMCHFVARMSWGRMAKTQALTYQKAPVEAVGLLANKALLGNLTHPSPLDPICPTHFKSLFLFWAWKKYLRSLYTWPLSNLCFGMKERVKDRQDKCMNDIDSNNPTEIIQVALSVISKI